MKYIFEVLLLESIFKNILLVKCLTQIRISMFFKTNFNDKISKFNAKIPKKKLILGPKSTKIVICYKNIKIVLLFFSDEARFNPLLGLYVPYHGLFCPCPHLPCPFARSCECGWFYWCYHYYLRRYTACSFGWSHFGSSYYFGCY